MVKHEKVAQKKRGGGQDTGEDIEDIHELRQSDDHCQHEYFDMSSTSHGSTRWKQWRDGDNGEMRNLGSQAGRAMASPYIKRPTIPPGFLPSPFSTISLQRADLKTALNNPTVQHAS